ncbi:hypothetical protein FHX48_000691 [Microbacterium halimionae]|uniref:Uncharacterized protein n=1 Tax=Microbacterium halimionae TaxID=1526413 RepID=A0A7W3PL97_9MICO|nr:hypothetical protein [Microbacterium halimionae]MBA8815639.1 hypothetical protein [Microbacterium halimionae]NII95686.1 hypothetical protein [Microbacterium halimionae]
MSASDIPDDVQEDVPPNPASGWLERVNDPDGAHRRRMASSKLGFGIFLISATLVAIIGLSVLQFLVSGVAGVTMNGAIDTLKLIATTALGFVFARSVGRGEE